MVNKITEMLGLEGVVIHITMMEVAYNVGIILSNLMTEIIPT